MKTLFASAKGTASCTKCLVVHGNAHIDDLSAVKTRKSKIILLLYSVFRHLTNPFRKKVNT